MSWFFSSEPLKTSSNEFEIFSRSPEEEYNTNLTKEFSLKGNYCKIIIIYNQGEDVKLHNAAVWRIQMKVDWTEFNISFFIYNILKPETLLLGFSDPQGFEKFKETLVI